ncbi:aminotransferase class V-fold PLP-dependent enzyme [Virgisporangium ochraceum]|uniref:Isopenicillin-N epimerase n=1 Tax=Virgisporangium ochraceum TaxID=65505 RepID=A0A8J4EAV8_9ACTN|nr:aminotransferase class V-fold PLP-dependent enzyme [Virgisporangium ochraceum]GIJ65172.1 isopenicillin-N epimerase [Virgisporangium ochraceum]
MLTVTPPEPVPGARLLFSLDPAVSHLNHGSFGAVPVPVQRAQQRLRDEMEANPVRFFAGGALDDRVTAARRHLATFVGLDPDGCAVIPNATTGVSIVLGSLDLARGDEILTTDHRYGAVAMAIERACRETGALVREVPIRLDATDDDVVAALRAAMSGRTRLVALDLITSPTARLMPVAAVHAALRGTGVPMFVDAAHAPGVISNPAPAEFWVGNLHKWAYAPRGTALLHVAARWRGRVRTPVVSWREAEGFPGSLEFSGVTDPTAWLAAPVGTYVLRTLGLDRVRHHNAALAAYAQATVGAALGHTPDSLPTPTGPPTGTAPTGTAPTSTGTRGRPASGTPGSPAEGTPGSGALPMRIVPLPAGIASTPDDAMLLRRRIADELQTEVQVSSWRNRGFLRLSANIYNLADEYDRLAERLPAFLKSL